MFKKLIISEEERKTIQSLYNLNEDFKGENGLVVAGDNKYQMYQGDDKIIYRGKVEDGYKMCKETWVGELCDTVPFEEINHDVMRKLEQQMQMGINPVNYTTPKGKKIVFKKV